MYLKIMILLIKQLIVKDSKGQPSKNLLTIEQLFQKLQYQYKNILLDKRRKDELLWQITNDWYNNKISKNSIYQIHHMVIHLNIKLRG